MKKQEAFLLNFYVRKIADSILNILPVLQRRRILQCWNELKIMSSTGLINFE